MSKNKEQFKHNLKRTKEIRLHNRKITKQFFRESDPDKKWKLFRSIESEDYGLLNNHLHHPDNY